MTTSTNNRGRMLSSLTPAARERIAAARASKSVAEANRKAALRTSQQMTLDAAEAAAPTELAAYWAGSAASSILADVRAGNVRSI